MKIISLFLIGCLLHSCIIYQLTDVSKSHLPDKEDKNVMIHAENISFRLTDFSEADSLYQGKVLYSLSVTPRTHVYIDSVMTKPESGQRISIPLEAISQVKVSEINTGLSVVVSTAIITSAFLLIRNMDFGPSSFSMGR